MAVRERPTLKQARFARAYAESGNGTQAVIDAGYKVKRREVARVMAPELLANPNVQQEVETWQQRLERNIVPSLKTIEDLRDSSADERVKLAASRDLLSRAGVGKPSEGKTNVLAVFGNMDEAALLEKMAQIVSRNNANVSANMIDVSPNVHYATQEKMEKQENAVSRDQGVDADKKD